MREQEMRAREQEMRARERAREQEMRARERESQQLNSDRYHLLLLSIVATGLRTEYTSVEDARLTWLLESQCLLRRLDNSPLESAILEPTMRAVGATNMRSIARDSHVLVELISAHM
jgi:hypothetical protein